MSRHFEFFDHLRMMRHGEAKVVTKAEMVDILPHYWRDERVTSPEEWFIKTGRGLGLNVHHQPERNYFVVTLSLP